MQPTDRTVHRAAAAALALACALAALCGCGLWQDASPERPSYAPGDRSGDAAAGPADVTITVADVPSGIPRYDRDEWRHWTDEDGDCVNTRHEVLIGESLEEVTFKDGRRCQVLTGRWYGEFTATTVTDAADLDIDHLVPLANAHRSGGWGWSAARKRSYANDLRDPGHLIAVTRPANSAKGASGPEDWRPPNEGFWCEYALAWTRIKREWGLTATRAEADALIEMLEGCPDPPGVEVVEADPGSRPVGPAPTEVPGTETYGSCEAAADAGLERVRGERGSGRGFPVERVPGAADGDGDGVVCER